MHKLKFPKFLGLAIVSVIMFASLLLVSLLTQPTNGQINPGSVPSANTIDAARLRAYQGGTNALSGVTTNKTFIVPGSLTNTFVIVNGIITSVQ